MIVFEPENRTFEYNDRFVTEDFKELKAYKAINDRAYVITEDTVRYYYQYAKGEWKFEKELLNSAKLNEGVQEFYYDLFFWPTEKLPERIFVISTAIFSKPD